jgi:ATP-dependent RNA helicase SUPV3L1/SUV3
MARGVAFQLVEALGVLDRHKVAEDVKGLDQPARATLRKYGVRFGAYHIYVPALLKPAPRLLAAELWVLKHGPVDGLTELQQLAASGRTSIPVDKAIDKALYRIVGYRVCGERALRVDILERLADLIRPALAWREGAPGVRPDGAIDGFGFTVSGAMTSLTGASGEDFASILRSLGYRMEKRPKPPEPPPAAETPAAVGAPTVTESETAAVIEITASEVAPEAAMETAAVEPVAEPTSEAAPSVVPDSEQIVSEAASPSLEPSAGQPEEIAAAEAGPLAAPQAESDAAAESASEVAPEAAAAAAAAKPAAEPELIEVWRPGRPPEERRSPRRHRRPRGEPAAQTAAPPEAAVAASDAAPGEAVAAAPGEAPPADAEQGERHHRRHRKRNARSDEARTEDGQQRAPRPPRSERPDRGERGGRPQKFRRSERFGRDRDDNRPPRTWNSEKPGRSKEPDPNSPFAKLAALKEQLEANKERH